MLKEPGSIRFALSKEGDSVDKSVVDFFSVITIAWPLSDGYNMPKLQGLPEQTVEFLPRDPQGFCDYFFTSI